MIGGNEDPKAKAMEKLWEAIDGLKNVLSLNPDPDSRVGQDLSDQLVQAQNQANQLRGNLDEIEYGFDSHHFSSKLDELERNLSQYARNSEPAEPVLAEAGPRRGGFGVANRNRDGEAFDAFRQLLINFLGNPEIQGGQGAAVRRDGGGDGGAGAGADGGGAGAGADGGAAGGAGAGAAGGDGGAGAGAGAAGGAGAGAGAAGGAGAGGALAGAGADGGASGGALAGAGAGADGGGAGAGAGDGGAGAVVEDGDLGSLIARVTQVLTRRTDEFRRMQDERRQLRVQASEVVDVVEVAKEVIDLFVAEARDAEERAQAAEAELARARAAEARAAEAERDRAQAAEAARAAQAEAERRADEERDRAAEAARADAEERARAAQAALDKALSTTEDAAQAAEAALARAQAAAERDRAVQAEAEAARDADAAQAAQATARADAARARDAEAARAEVARAQKVTESLAKDRDRIKLLAKLAKIFRSYKNKKSAAEAPQPVDQARRGGNRGADSDRISRARALRRLRARSLSQEDQDLEERLKRIKNSSKPGDYKILFDQEGGEEDGSLQKLIKSQQYSIRELREALTKSDEETNKLKKNLKKAIEEAEKKGESNKRFRSLLKFIEDVNKTKGWKIPQKSDSESDDESDNESKRPKPPGPDPAVPSRPEDPPAPVSAPEQPKKPVVLSDDEKRRNALYLRLNFNETAIPEPKKDGRSNLFLVITDEAGDGSSRKVDDSRPLNSYVLSDRACFFSALNNEVDFLSGNGVRICFMKSSSRIKVGDCDITEQSFIDINDEIAKTRIFIDENGRKKIEDYRIRLEEEFKKFLGDNKNKECNENFKNANLSKINSLNGLADLNGLKTLMTTWGTSQGIVKVKVFDDDLSTEEAIEKKAKELADDTLANRFKSGIIGVEVEKTGVGAGVPAAAAGAGAPAPAPAPAKEYEDVAIGFIKVVRSKKPDEPVRVFVGETAGPTTANIWDKDTQSYVQISLKTTQIGEGVDKKTVIDEANVQQIAQNGQTTGLPTSKLPIDLFIEKTGDRSGLFAPAASPASGSPLSQDQGSELQMLQKIEIRGGNKVEGGGGYYLTNGFAHQKEGEPSNENNVLFVGKIKATTTQGQDTSKNIEFFQSINSNQIGIKINSGRDQSKCKEKLISEFMEKAIPQYKTPDNQSKHVQGIVLRHEGQMNISEIGVSNDFNKYLSRALPCATPQQNPAGDVTITQKTFSKTSAPKPATNPSGASAGPAQQTSSSCFPFCRQT
jgi:hypothetical protein